MKGIILAAGRGSRMGSLTDDQPKCRTVFRNKELIEWQQDALKKANIDDIGIVVGYLAESFNFDVSYFTNQRWFETNIVRSLIAADEWLRTDTCITSYSDIVYSDDAVNRLKQAPGDVAITYDPNWEHLWSLRFDDPLSDAETFQLNDDNCVVEIGGRASSAKEIKGQYMGLVKYTPTGWEQVANLLEQLPESEVDAMDVTNLFQLLIAADIKIHAVPIADQWFEVDSRSDLLKYESIE